MNISNKAVTKVLGSLLAILCLSTAIASNAQAGGGYYKFTDPVTGETTFSFTPRRVQGSAVKQTPQEYGPGRKLEGKISGDKDLRWNVKK